MRKLRLFCRSALFAAACFTSSAQAQDSTTPGQLIQLPGDQVYPESVTIDQNDGTFFVGSVKEGTIFKGQVGRPDVAVFSPAGADGRQMANGLFYANGKLIVLGRQSGQIFVYDAKNAQLVTKLHNGLNGTEQTFLNDVVFARDGSAYVTDSVNPVLYRVTPGAQGKDYQLGEFLKFDGTPISYTKAQGAPGINLNGIVVTPDGRYLIVAKRNENALYRIDLQSREIIKVDLGQDRLNTPDGLFLADTTLYAAQNTPKTVAVLTFSNNFSQAKLDRTISDPSFAFPTAVARYKDKLLVVSAQFDTKGSPAAVSGDTPPRTPFWLTELPEKSGEKAPTNVGSGGR
jgi:sugar lactone lactonase YvrE